MGLLVRRAEPGDHRGLTSLVSKAGGPALFRKLFGSYNFGQMIETSYLSVTALHVFDEVTNNGTTTPSTVATPKPMETLVGFAILSDTPRAGLSEDWLEWFSETYVPADAEITMTNTLWVEFAVALGAEVAAGRLGGGCGEEDEEAAGVIENIVRTVFTTLPEVDYLVMSLSGGVDGNGIVEGVVATPKFLLRAFEVLSRHADAPPNNLDEAYGKPKLLLCDRMAFLPTLAVRPACVEDHDDLMPVFAAQSDLLSATYGEFFLADMIELQDDENKALAALVQGRACGLLATSSDLDLTLLQNFFVLDEYEHLVKIPPETRTQLALHRRKKLEGVRRAGETHVGVTEAPRVLLLGPPGAGKTTLALALAAQYGSVLVSVDIEARFAADSGLEQGERAMKLLDAGEVLPDGMVLNLVAPKLASRECQLKGWVLEGLGTAGGAEELEEAIVMATEVGMEDFTATRPSIVIVLDLQLEADVLARVTGRRVDAATGHIYHETFQPPPPSGGDDGFIADPLPGDGDTSAVAARLSSYRTSCDKVVRTFAIMHEDGQGNAQQSARSAVAEDEAVFRHDLPVGAMHQSSVPQEGVVAYIRAQPGGAVGCVFVLNAAATVDSILKHAGEAVDAKTAANRSVAGHDAGQGGIEDGGSMSSAVLAALPPNAFAITLFCLESRLESRATDFLPHVFLLYPDRDYCVLTVPSVGAESVLLRHFIPVPAKPGSAFNHVLYVVHRDSLPAFKYLRVSRFLGSSHRAGVSHLVDCWGGADIVMTAVKDADQHQGQELIDNPPSAAFVATLGHQVVAVIVASREACGGDEVAQTRSEFHVEDFISFERHRPRNQAVLTALALNPIFSGHCRFALKEVMRLYDKSVLYYRSPPGTDLPTSVPWHMIPVRPRYRMQPQPGDVATRLSGGGGRRRLGYEHAALYFLSRRFVTEPKITANRRVVVIGASSCALACLEGLVFTPYLNLTSLTLVSPEGLPTSATATQRKSHSDLSAGDLQHWGQEDGSGEVRFSPVDEDAPDADRMARMGLERHVRIVRSRLVDLDRDNSAILLPDGSVVPYDVLVLCTGLQDVTSRRLGLWAPGLNTADPAIPGFISLDSPFLHNKIQQALHCNGNSKKNIVIYAGALKAYCAARGLMDLGIEPHRIIIVHPATSASASAGTGSAEAGTGAGETALSLGDAAIDSAVAAAAAEAGIIDVGQRYLETIQLGSKGAVVAAVFADSAVAGSTRSGDGCGVGGNASGARTGVRSGKSSETRGRDTKTKRKSGGFVGGDGKGSGEEGKHDSNNNGDVDDCDNGDSSSDDASIIRCGLLLCGDTPNADTDVFRAANNSGLVYDGRLVVDAKFTTSDRSVLAGGTLTKFSRAHGAGAPRHQSYNAREVGTYLAACVLQQVDPLTLVEIDADADGKSGRGSYTRDSHPNASGESAATAAASVPLDDGAVSATTPCSTPPPIFELPRCVSGKLPGNLVYARAVLPPMPTRLKKSKRPSEDAGADADPDTRQSASSSVAQEGSRAVKSFTTGAVLTGVGSETGEGSAASGGEGGGGYCVVRVDSLDSVCDVIYCGHQPVEAKNLSKIVGVQLGYLQQLEYTFENGEVSSWIEFFRRGCFTPIYHDRFPQLAEELRAVLGTGDEPAADLLAALDEGINEGMADNWLSITIRKAVGRGASELPPSTRKTVEATALEWVRRNRTTLPQLSLPQSESLRTGAGADSKPVGGGLISEESRCRGPAHGGEESVRPTANSFSIRP